MVTDPIEVLTALETGLRLLVKIMVGVAAMMLLTVVIKGFMMHNKQEIPR